MAEFARTVYNFNDRLKLNDVATDTTKYVLVDPSAFMDTIIQNTEEPRVTEMGIVDYGSHTGKGTAKVPVLLYAETESKMNGLIQTFKTAFDPESLERDATYGEAAGKEGYVPLKWTEDVDGTSRAFQIFLKSVETPRVSMDNLSGTVRGSMLALKAQDPRKYLQGVSSLTGAGTAANAGTTTTPMVITIVANGTTATNLTITNSTRSESLIISTALTNGQTLVIDTRLHSVKLNGVEHREYLSSSSKWMLLNPGNNTIAVTNTTGVASVTEAWYSAWPL